MLKIRESIFLHAEQESPKESCGLIIISKGKEKYIPCRNVSDVPEECFVIHPEDYADAEDEGEIAVIVHSHPKTDPRPSKADILGLKNSGLPWIIVNPNTKGYTRTNPENFPSPLVGRKYVWGSADCFTIVQDYYKETLGIKLPDVIRTGNPINMRISEHFQTVGFESVDVLEKNDLIVMRCKSNFPDHLGVYLGDGDILHHVFGRLSSKDAYGNAGYWYQNTWGYLRHVDLIGL